MQSDKKRKMRAALNWWSKRIALGLFDILAVNLAYFVALVIRFYVNGEFRPVAIDTYLPAFWRFAPYYTVISIAVFVLFRLYNNRWRFAGIHDLNRVICASVVTAAIHVAGTLLFVCRMPMTYYAIGAALQLILIAASRFIYKLVVLEYTRMRRRSSTKLNVMIVGIDETARILRSQIESDSANVARPVCVFSYKDERVGEMINGLPVVSELEKLPEYFGKYQIRCVILADSLMPMEIRRQIRSVCQDNQVEVQDFSGYLQQGGPGLPHWKLLERVVGPLVIVLDGRTTSYDNSEKALMELPGNYSVRRIQAREGRVVVELTTEASILNDVRKDWVRDTEEETGNEISFF